MSDPPRAPPTDCITEDGLLRLFEGRLSAQDRARVESHVDDCPRCLDLMAAAARGLSPDSSGAHATPDAAAAASPRARDRVDPGSSLSVGRVVQDRYEIRGRVGIGAMGVVFAAFDRVLDRNVALKVLRPDRVDGADVRAQARLVREARLLARLSHPNVIVVYDVAQEVSGVVMAMELVAGRTLTAWLAGPPQPSRAEILAAFLAAGRGLAAAHAAGVVHRDLKPDNVLVGDDGRVRVTDFGLAHSPRRGATEPAAEPASAAMDESAPAVVGTPRYMAPEQYDGRAADTRSDQFAFAVSLYEALYRESPFPLTTGPARLAAIRAGQCSPPVRAGVPRWLRAALLRALQADPARRFPTMDALCDAIDPARRRRLHMLATGLASTVAAALLGALVLAPVRALPPCTSAAERLAGIWDPSVRDQLAATIAATGDPEVQARWPALARDLDAATSVWAERHDAACAAVTASDEAEREAAAINLSCLDHSIEWLRAAAEMSARADARTLNFLARRHLPDLMNQACAHRGDARYDPLPVDRAERQRVTELRMQLGEVLGLEEEGRLHDARQLAARVVDDARSSGFAPVIAEALFRRGTVEHKMGALADAQRTLESALAVAETARHDIKIPHIWLELALLDIALGRLDEASRGLDRATAFFSRYPLSRSTAEQLGAVRASILRALGRHREAIEAEELTRSGAPEDELQLARRLVNAANSHAALGEVDQALALNHRSLAIRERHLGPDHSRVAGVLNNIGALLIEQKQYDEARHYLERALRIRERLGEGNGVEVSHVLINIGTLEREQGRVAAARAHLERVLALRETILGCDHILVAEALHSLGSLLVAGHEADRGRPLLARARAIRDHSLGPAHPVTALTLVDLAHAERARGQPAAARDLLEAALEVLSAAEVHPAQLAAASFALAQLIDEDRSDPLRVRRLSEAALAALRPLGRAYARQRAEVEAFLAARPAP